MASPSHPSWKSGQGRYLVGNRYGAILVALRMVPARRVAMETSLLCLIFAQGTLSRLLGLCTTSRILLTHRGCHEPVQTRIFFLYRISFSRKSKTKSARTVKSIYLAMTWAYIFSELLSQITPHEYISISIIRHT